MSEHHGHDAGEHDHDHGGMGKYMAVFGMLCVLTAISFWIGNSPLMNNAPAVAMIGMIVVSCAKAMLVLLFFMHLKWEANWKYVLTIPAAIMAVFMILMLIPDVGWRTKHYSNERLKFSADPQVQPVDHSSTEGSSSSSNPHH